MHMILLSVLKFLHVTEILWELLTVETEESQSGKWLFNSAKILIMDEPTAGIDIGSKADIYNIINELVLSGARLL